MDHSEFSAVDKGIIRNMLVSCSYKQISETIGRSVQDISLIVNAEFATQRLVTKQQRIDVKAAARKEQRPVRAAKKSLPPDQQKLQQQFVKKQKQDAEKLAAQTRKEERLANQRERAMVNHQRIQKNNLNSRAVKTKVVDYSSLVIVRIDAKTWIYAKPGDEEEARRKHMEYHKPVEVVTGPITGRWAAKENK